MLNRSYIRIIFFFFFVCYFSGTSLSAQEYLVKSFGAKQGLASAEIYTMFQDDDGYLAEISGRESVWNGNLDLYGVFPET